MGRNKRARFALRRAAPAAIRARAPRKEIDEHAHHRARAATIDPSPCERSAYARINNTHPTIDAFIDAYADPRTPPQYLH
jgi:hypothetical protein